MRVGTFILLIFLVILIIPIRIHVEYKKKLIISIKYMFIKKYFFNTGNIINGKAKKNNLKTRKYYSEFKKYKKFLNKKLIKSHSKLLKFIFKTGIKIKKTNLKCELFVVDAAVTCVIYGLICSALYTIYPTIKRKYAKIKIFPNFIKQQNSVEFFFLIHINLLVTSTLALIIAFKLLFDLLKLKRMMNKQNKATES